MPTKKGKPDPNEALLKKALRKAIGFSVCPKCGAKSLVIVKGYLQGFVGFGCWHTQVFATLHTLKAILKKAPTTVRKRAKTKRAKA